MSEIAISGCRPARFVYRESNLRFIPSSSPFAPRLGSTIAERRSRGTKRSKLAKDIHELNGEFENQVRLRIS